MIILASASPRRAQLLHMAEIPYEVIAPNIEETYPAHLSIPEIPVYIATQKGKTIAQQFPERPIIAADTIVVLKNRIIGKPLSREDAIQMLKDLQGQSHEVITGVYIRLQTGEHTFYDRTKVQFHPLSEAEIVHYVDEYKPYDKAGAYAIQEWIGSVAIHSIEGCFYNVMGLPVSRVYQILKTNQAGIE